MSSPTQARKRIPSLLQWLCIAVVLLSQVLSAQSKDAPVKHPVIDEALIPVVAIAPLASDGFAGEAFLRKPPGEGPFPAVLLVHGGAPRWDTTTLREFIVHTHASRFLAAGYVVVAMTRRPLDLSLPADAEQPAVRDAVAMIDYIKSLPYVDRESVVVRGTSVGAYLTLEVAAARDVAAISIEEPFSFPFVGISIGNRDGKSADSTKIENIVSPILLIRGDQTPSINDFNREVFIPAVQTAGKSLQILTYPGELHSFAFYDSAERTKHPEVSLEAFNAMSDFFSNHLSVQPVRLDAVLVRYEAVQLEGAE